MSPYETLNVHFDYRKWFESIFSQTNTITDSTTASTYPSLPLDLGALTKFIDESSDLDYMKIPKRFEGESL